MGNGKTRLGEDMDFKSQQLLRWLNVISFEDKEELNVDQKIKILHNLIEFAELIKPIYYELGDLIRENQLESKYQTYYELLSKIVFNFGYIDEEITQENVENKWIFTKEGRALIRDLINSPGKTSLVQILNDIKDIYQKEVTPLMLTSGVETEIADTPYQETVPTQSQSETTEIKPLEAMAFEIPNAIDPTIINKFIKLIFKSYGLDSENKAYFKVEFQDIEPKLFKLKGELKIIGGNQKSYDTKSVTDVLDSLMSIDPLPEDKLESDLREFIEKYKELAELFTNFQNKDLTKDTSKRESLVESFLRLVQRLKELSESTSLKKNLDDIKAEHIESRKTPLDKFRDNFKSWKKKFNEQDHSRMTYKDEIIEAIEQNLLNLHVRGSIEITIKQKTVQLGEGTDLMKLPHSKEIDISAIINSLNLYYSANGNGLTFWFTQLSTTGSSTIFKIGLYKD